MRTSILLFALLSSLGAVNGHAALMRIDFVGQWVSEDVTFEPDSPWAVGQSFAGYFIYDDAATAVEPILAFGLHFEGLGAIAWNLSDALPGFGLGQYFTSPPLEDWILIAPLATAQPADPDAGWSGDPSLLTFEFTGPDAPLPPWRIFDVGMSLGGANSLFWVRHQTFAQSGNPAFVDQSRGTVSSVRVTALPEPGGTLCLATGFLVLLALGQVRSSRNDRRISPNGDTYCGDGQRFG